MHTDTVRQRIAWIGVPVLHSGQRSCHRERPDNTCWYAHVEHYLTAASPCDWAVVFVAKDEQWPEAVRQLTSELWQRCLPAAPILWLQHVSGEPLWYGLPPGVVEVICGAVPLDVVHDRVMWAAQRWSPIGRTLWAMRELVVRQGRLTQRQREFCDLLVRGYGVKQIAARWGVSPHTVRNQRNRIFEKLGLQSEAELSHVWTTLEWLDRIGALLQRASTWVPVHGWLEPEWED